MAFEPTAKLATVIGGSGFVGRYVVQELARNGWRVRVVCRNPATALFLKPLGELGQIQLCAGDVTRPASLKAAVQGADAVINLVGILKGDFEAVQAAGAEAVAKAAAAAGAAALVYISAIGADPESESRYGKSKGEGEARVLAAFPKATILRPSIIFGPEDQFINRFARMAKRMPVVPVIRGATRFQPVYVCDVAEAVAKAAADPKHHGGKIFELAGPKVYSFRELVDWTAHAIGAKRKLVDVPDTVACAMAAIGSFVPGAPITRDQYLMLARDNVASAGAEGLAAFGITPTPLEAVAPDWLVHLKKQGRFTDLRGRTAA